MQATTHFARLIIATIALGSVLQCVTGGDESSDGDDLFGGKGLVILSDDTSPKYRIHDNGVNFPPSRNPSRDLSSSRPSCTHRLARPDSQLRYFGYYVGGTRRWLGDGRLRHEEGTWGWDYSGILFNKAVVLDWAHGRVEVGKSGSYATDRRGLR